MPKRPPHEPTASDFADRERILLFCIASGIDWQQAGVPGETVVDMIVKGLVVDQGLDRLALTARGRAVLRAMLPEV